MNVGKSRCNVTKFLFCFHFLVGWFLFLLESNANSVVKLVIFQTIVEKYGCFENNRWVFLCLNFESPFNCTEFGEEKESLAMWNILLTLKAERISYYLCVKEDY